MLPNVRVYEPKDREGVIALWDRVFPDDPPWNEPVVVIERKLTMQPDLFFVCEADEAIVGTALAGFDGHRGWVHKVAIDPRYRRLGISRLHMKAAERGQASRGCRKLNLQVRDGNDGAVSFYEAIGFSIEERTSMSKHIGDERDA